jgi:hypothetical protein
MAKRMSEDDFVNEGLSDDEKAQMTSTEPETDHEPEAETETEAAPQAGVLEKKADPEPEPDKKAEAPQTVDIRALQEARAESREIKEQYRRLEERTNAMLKMMSEPKKEDAAEDDRPDPNEDIFAFSQWQAKQLEALNQKFTQQEQQAQQSVQQQAAEQAVWGAWEGDSLEYAQANPDFRNAAKWLAETRDKQLQAFSSVDPRFGKAARYEFGAGRG